MEIKLMHQKNVYFVTTDFLKVLYLDFKNIFVINVMIY